MFKKENELKIYGYLMFFLGVIDIAYMAIDIREVNTLLEGYSQAVAIGVYAFFAVCALITLAKFWMGHQALQYAKGTGKGTSHIKLAKIGMAVTILVLVSDAFAIYQGTADISEILSTSTSLIVMHSYYTAAKACL